MLEFVCGSPLGAAQRAGVAAETAAQYRRDPAAVRAASSRFAIALAVRAHADPAEVADFRRRMRLQIALLQNGDPVRTIVEAKDHTIYFDRDGQYLVTESTLAAWRDGAGWMARLLDRPAPAADFDVVERRFVRDRFAGLSVSEKDAIANVQSTFPIARIAVEHADRAKLAADMPIERAKARASGDFPLYAAASLDAVAVTAMKSIFMRRLITGSTLLDSGANAEYFNHRNEQLLSTHSHATVLPPPVP